MLWVLNEVRCEKRPIVRRVVAFDGVQKTLFILVNYDKLTIVDNQNWFSVHLYVTKWVETGPNFA
jgi:hypothetical protein